MYKSLPLPSLCKFILLSSITFGICTPVYISAHRISPEEAIKRVKKYSDASLSSEEKRIVNDITAATRSEERQIVTIGNLYVLTTPDNYIVVPSDDCAPALLGYSDTGTFSPEINPELSYWLDFYNRELSSLAGDSGSEQTREESERPSREPIAPLTKTRWNQEAPYNDLCPTVNGHKTVTGCVATAMAQVLKFFSYPAKGQGTHSYHWEPGNETLSFDYGATTFEWDKMTDTYGADSSEEARKAVATLMLACGISVDMHYNIGDSGASTMAMGASLIDYFGYDKGIWMPMRDYYGLYDWEEMVYSELSEGRPVLYSGVGTAGGHQFICDGYSSDGFFHFNWGWGGLSDGYFRLTALNPANLGVGGGAGGFNSGQQITLGVKPAEQNSEHHYLMYCTSSFIPMEQEVTAGQELRFKGGFYNYSLSSLPDDSKIGVKITSEESHDIHYEAGYGIDGLRPLTGYNEDFIRFPELADGEYIITPAFYDGKNWNDIPTPVGSTGSCRAKVVSGVAKLSSPEAASVSVTEIKVPETIYKDCQFPLEFTVVNDGDNEFLGDVYPVLVNPVSEETVATSLYRPVDVDAGAKFRVTDYIGEFTAVKDAEFEPGEYLLLFHNREGKAISDSVKVTVEATPENTVYKVTDFQLDEKDPVTDKESVKFTFAITCEEGYFTDRLHLYIFPGDYGHSLTGAASEMIYLPAGEKHYGAITIDLSDLPAGEYIACLFKGDRECSDQIRFRLADDSSGIVVTTPDIIDMENAIIYDLNGMRHKAPLQPGIYIINGIKTLIR